MIRPATHSDITRIEEINPFSGNRAVEIDEARLTVIDSAGSVAGFVVESRNGLLGRPYIEYLAVGKEYRRRGLALALLKAIEAKHSGKRLFISTESSNSAMLRLLERSAYIQSGSISNANVSGADELYFFKQLT